MKIKSTLKRIKYWTMDSWNNSTAPAYNMKIYNIIRDREIKGKLYDLMGFEETYFPIDQLIEEFATKFNYRWQAGFNGRSGGYLVLYKGGVNSDGSIYSQPGLGIDIKEVPVEVRKAFRKLALDIQNTAVWLGQNAQIVDDEETVEVKRVVW